MLFCRLFYGSAEGVIRLLQGTETRTVGGSDFECMVWRFGIGDVKDTG